MEPDTVLGGKQVVVGVPGDGAAVEAPGLCRALGARGAEITAVLAGGSQGFVGPRAFEAAGVSRVIIEGSIPAGGIDESHVSLADLADCVVLNPMTQALAAKIGLGLADDLLSTLLMTVRVPVIAALASNVGGEDTVQEIAGKLAGMGCRAVAPRRGEYFPHAGRIIEAVEEALTSKDLAGERVLVTAGRTEEEIDPVRFISNRSSGKMGFAVARAARNRGADVVLVHGPTALEAPDGVLCVPVRSALEMREMVMESLTDAGIVIKVAAVSDFRPIDPAVIKVKKDKMPEAIRLERTPDILLEIGSLKGGRTLVGFAAETGDRLDEARRKLETKNLDLVVLNNVSRPDSGFDTDTNQVTIVGRDGDVEALGTMTKCAVANRILDRVVLLRPGPASSADPSAAADRRSQINDIKN